MEGPQISSGSLVGRQQVGELPLFLGYTAQVTGVPNLPDIWACCGRQPACTGCSEDRGAGDRCRGSLLWLLRQGLQALLAQGPRLLPPSLGLLQTRPLPVPSCTPGRAPPTWKTQQPPLRPCLSQPGRSSPCTTQQPSSSSPLQPQLLHCPPPPALHLLATHTTAPPLPAQHTQTHHPGPPSRPLLCCSLFLKALPHPLA